MVYNGGMEEVTLIGERYDLISWALNERQRRLFAATEAKVIGRGGITVSQKSLMPLVYPVELFM